MAPAMDPAAHRERAAALLDESYTKGIASPARSVILAEAQVHATLAVAGMMAPPVLQIPESLELSPEELQSLASARMVVTTDPQVGFAPVAAPDAKPATKRRTRKAAAPKVEEAAQ